MDHTELCKRTVTALRRGRFNLSTEAELKEEMLPVLNVNVGVTFIPEYVLDKNNRPDFFFDGVAIEVKIKGSPVAILKQCERYCQFDEVKSLILYTNKSMGFPEQINGKDCYVVHAGKSWL